MRDATRLVRRWPLLAATVTAVLAAGCTGGHGPADDGTRADADPGPDPGQERRRQGPGEQPGPVLAVKIDNAPAARPADRPRRGGRRVRGTGRGRAEPADGGVRRHAAEGRRPGAQRPRVRSGAAAPVRRPVARLLRGAAQAAAARSTSAPLQRGARRRRRPDAYFRGTGKAAPHNLYLRPDRLLHAGAGRRGAARTGFRFGAAPAGGTAGEHRARSATRRPASPSPGPRTVHRWLVSMDGTPTVTTDGKRVAPATVVVQYVKMRKSAFHDFLGNNTPYTETVGSGTAQVLRDGRVLRRRLGRGQSRGRHGVHDEGRQAGQLREGPGVGGAGQGLVISPALTPVPRGVPPGCGAPRPRPRPAGSGRRRRACSCGGERRQEDLVHPGRAHGQLAVGAHARRR